jgi:hypothetical protein
MKITYKQPNGTVNVFRYTQNTNEMQLIGSVSLQNLTNEMKSAAFCGNFSEQHRTYLLTCYDICKNTPLPNDVFGRVFLGSEYGDISYLWVENKRNCYEVKFITMKWQYGQNFTSKRTTSSPISLQTVPPAASLRSFAFIFEKENECGVCGNENYEHFTLLTCGDFSDLQIISVGDTYFVFFLFSFCLKKIYFLTFTF